MNRRTWWWLALSIAALALAASANSIANGYAYDDVTLIAQAARVHSLDGWWREFGRTYWPEGDGYRPLTVLAWRAQWAFGGGAPAVFHATNVALHAATTVAVFWLGGAVLPVAAAWIAAALYAVHPVHTEAIANVVGQSELAVALLVVVALGLYVHGRLVGAVSERRWAGIGTLWAAACLFKEHAIVAPALILLAEATVVRDTESLRTRFERLRLPLLTLALVAAAFLWARSAVVIDGFAGFRPFVVFDALHLSAGDRVFTMVGAAPEWLRLLLWPARLITQYTPPYIEVAQGPSASQLPGVLILLGAVGIMIASWRRAPAASFGIGWVILTLLPASNFIIPAGFIIAERTLLLPSVGAMLAVASAVPWVRERLELRPRVAAAAAVTAVAVLLLLGVARSVTRNRVWHDDDTLWRQGVLDSPDSYRAHFMLGLHHFSNGRFHEGELHYRRAIELFPHDPVMAYAFAEQLRTSGRCDAAIPIYHWLFGVQPDSRRGHIGYAACMLEQKQFPVARQHALEWIRKGGRLSLAREILASAKAQRDSVPAR